MTLPHDGSLTALRRLLDGIDDARSRSTGLAVHTPDLDDVFLALTGRPATDESPEEVTG